MDKIMKADRLLYAFDWEGYPMSGCAEYDEVS